MTPPKAFVPGYEHDVFVSYAHVDDKSPPGAEQGWVTTFIGALEDKVVEAIGRPDLSLWMDHELSRHKPVTSEIGTTLETTAILVVILSPGYLASDWCRREKVTFLEAVGKRHRSGVIFVVEKSRLDEDARPPEFEDLKGYRFWVDDRPGRRPRTLGDPVPDPADREYYDLLNDLGYDIARHLRELRSARDGGGEDTSPEEAKATVLLAEATDDLDQLRNSVRRHLDQAGIRSLPEKNYYPRDPDRFREAMAQDLAECKLFVQLLSAAAGKKTPDLPQGYLGLQLELATEAGLPLLQWRSSETNPRSVGDRAHQSLLEAETVVAMGIQEFKTHVVEEALRKEKVQPLEAVEAFVFVDTEQGDRSLADGVCQTLHRLGVGYALPLRKGTTAEVRKDLVNNLLACDVMIVIYGTCEPAWVREQLNQLIRVVRQREQPLSALAIFEGPPPEKDPLDYRLPYMETLDGREGIRDAQIRAFLEAANKERGH